MGNIINDLNTTDENLMNVLYQKNQYYAYVLEHQRNVMIAYIKLFSDTNVERLIELGLCKKEDIECLKQEIIHHDESKFSDEEFEPYRRKFNPTEYEKNKKISEEESQQIEDSYQSAWKHHYMYNDHHPLYWRYHKYDNNNIIQTETMLNTPTDMSIVPILHMICDWEAMSIKFNSNTVKWWKEEAVKEEQKDLSNKTIRMIENIFDVLFVGGEV